jgi:hypothetical protein
MMVIGGYARLTVPAEAALSGLLPDECQSELRAPLLRMDRLCGLSVVVAARLFAEQPGLRDGVNGDEVAVVVASAHGCHKTDEEYYRSYLHGQPSPRLFAYTLPSSPSGELSILYRLRGPGLMVSTGRTSGLAALVEAELLLRTNQAAACLVVAVEVAQPLFGAASVADAAVALWLTRATSDVSARSVGTISSIADSFCGRQSAEALHRVLPGQTGHPAETIFCDDETLRLAGAVLSPERIRLLPVPGGAVAGLWLLGEALSVQSPSAVCACVDATGMAVAARLVPATSVSARL